MTPKNNQDLTQTTLAQQLTNVNQQDNLQASRLLIKKQKHDLTVEKNHQRTLFWENKKSKASNTLIKTLISLFFSIEFFLREKFKKVRHYSFLKLVHKKKEFTSRMAGENIKSKLIMMLIRFVFLALMGVIVIFPFYWMVSIAFRSPTEINDAASGQMSLWPQTWSLEAFNMLFNNPKAELNITTAIGISFAVSITSIATQTSISLIGGFGISHLRTRANEFFVMVLLAAMMLPGEALLVGQYLIATKLDMKETFAALFVPFLGNAFTIFLFMNAFDGITDSIKKAARIDGVSDFKFFWKVALPLVKPIIFTSVLMAFITSWNSILWPQMVIIENKKLYTLPMILWNIMNSTGDPQSVWAIDLPDGGKLMDPQNLKMAASIIAIVPMFIIFVLTKKYLIRGITNKNGSKE
ncbi:carbohydrate ABC transporter permease [Williamsoniiplasma lucivorax]|uniref:sn-glycerol-3-phosphate ABC transporter permease n=1 Tax=Williamsoniiplasma lucivorax TaxID=209274 RepID=A0A2S5RF51_9MOLU|nr:carbohydrate ABC transporter permease [Williamsoniiplasma lucivorax]PPE05940.1 sn-glycerol-3-phosphate ABC transporter permease [Williamsoniiplasma lucivorax]